MKPSLLLPGIVFFFVFCLSEVQGASDAQDDRPLRNADDFRRYMSELSNWGRWGKEDQLGALNLVTAQKRRDSLALVKEGVSVSLARDVEKEKAEDNGSPFVHVMDLSHPWPCRRGPVLR